MKQSLLWLMALAVFTQCKTTKNTNDSEWIVQEAIVDAKKFREAQIDTNSFKFVTYEVQGHYFKTEVLTRQQGKFSFTLLGNGMMAKSLPPKTALKLVMINEKPEGDDKGIVLQSYRLSFDLRPVSKDYNGEIILQINQLKNLIYKPKNEN